MAKQHYGHYPNKNEKLPEIDLNWISKPNQISNEVISWADTVGKNLATNGLTTSQIRRFFGEMRRIQSSFDKNKEDIPMMKAKLAYNVGRETDTNKKYVIKSFFKLLAPGLDAVDQDKEKFNRFVKICEAIISFHKFRGGRDK